MHNANADKTAESASVVNIVNKVITIRIFTLFLFILKSNQYKTEINIAATPNCEITCTCPKKVKCTPNLNLIIVKIAFKIKFIVNTKINTSSNTFGCFLIFEMMNMHKAGTANICCNPDEIIPLFQKVIKNANTKYNAIKHSRKLNFILITLLKHSLTSINTTASHTLKAATV